MYFLIEPKNSGLNGSSRRTEALFRYFKYSGGEIVWLIIDMNEHTYNIKGKSIIGKIQNLHEEVGNSVCCFRYYNSFEYIRIRNKKCLESGYIIDVDDHPFRGDFFFNLFMNLIPRLKFKQALQKAKCVLYSCDEDLDSFCERSLVLPHFHKSHQVDIVRSEIKGQQVLFVADLMHGPNYLGLLEFLEKTHTFWPENITLAIVGRCSLERKERIERKFPRKWLLLKGYVDSIANEYNSSFAVLNFVTTGKGANVKSQEALLYGKRLICYDHGVRGLPKRLLQDFDVCICQNHNEILRYIISLKPEALETTNRRAALFVEFLECKTQEFNSFIRLN